MRIGPEQDFMRRRAPRTLAVTAALTLAVSAGALAAGPLKGKTYQGKTSASGVNQEGHSQTIEVAAITLRVAASGKSVSVRFPSSSPILYCTSAKLLRVQSTKPAKISGGGTFRAAVSQRYTPGPGAAPIVQVIGGKFSGRTVKGTIHTEAGECSGSTTFSATAR